MHYVVYQFVNYMKRRGKRYKRNKYHAQYKIKLISPRLLVHTFVFLIPKGREKINQEEVFKLYCLFCISDASTCEPQLLLHD